MLVWEFDLLLSVAAFIIQIGTAVALLKIINISTTIIPAITLLRYCSAMFQHRLCDCVLRSISGLLNHFNAFSSLTLGSPFCSLWVSESFVAACQLQGGLSLQKLSILAAYSLAFLSCSCRRVTLLFLLLVYNELSAVHEHGSASGHPYMWMVFATQHCLQLNIEIVLNSLSVYIEIRAALSVHRPSKVL